MCKQEAEDPSVLGPTLTFDAFSRGSLWTSFWEPTFKLHWGFSSCRRAKTAQPQTYSRLDSGRSHQFMPRKPDDDSPPIENETLPVAVKLLQAVQVPAQHGKIVTASIIDCPDYDSAALFITKHDLCHKEGIVVEDAVIDPESDGRVTLIVQNNSLLCTCISGGR